MATKSNAFDKFIGYFSPTAGLERAKARAKLNVVKRFYEGASQGRRTEGWVALDSGSATSITTTQIVTLRNRARDLVRNQPFASRALSSIVSNTIGHGIQAQIKNSSQSGTRGLQPLKDAWEAWAETTDIDFAGKKDYFAIQSLVMRTLVEAGEALVVRRYRTRNGKKIPIQCQVLEPDYIDSNKTDEDTVQGVKFDTEGRAVGVWLFKKHPGDNPANALTFGQANESILFDSKDIIHLFREDRAGQVRGVTWFAPVIISIRDLDEYMDSTLVKQKVASAFAAFVKDIEMPAEFANENEAPLSDKLTPGLIEILPPGKDIVFPNSPSVNEFDPFTRTLLRAVSAGLNLPYENLTNDYSQVNFSSGRMGWLEFQRALETWRWQLVIPQLCTRISDWFLEAAQLIGINTNGAYFVHSPPSREMINPGEEIKALSSAVRNGFKSWADAVKELGDDPEERLEEIAEWNERFDEEGVILDCDPRKIMASSGSLQASSSAAPSDAPAADPANPDAPAAKAAPDETPGDDPQAEADDGDDEGEENA